MRTCRAVALFSASLLTFGSALAPAGCSGESGVTPLTTATSSTASHPTGGSSGSSSSGLPTSGGNTSTPTGSVSGATSTPGSTTGTTRTETGSKSATRATRSTETAVSTTETNTDSTTAASSETTTDSTTIASSETTTATTTQPVCNDLTPQGDFVAVTCGDTPPRMNGGTFVDGTYQLTAKTLYQASCAPGSDVQSTLEVIDNGTTGQLISVTHGVTTTDTLALATSGIGFTANPICGTGLGPGEYTATPESISFLVVESGVTLELVFQKQ